MFPVIDLMANYPRSGLGRDLGAGVVLAAVLVPAGMGYAEASGLRAIHGLYASLAALVAYAVMGPSRILILGPDSSLVPLVAATVIPLSAGDPGRAASLAAALACLAGIFCLIAGVAKLGFLTDLLSMPIRVGYLNGIALTLLVGQLPKVFGFSRVEGEFFAQAGGFWEGIRDGQTDLRTLSIGLAALITILVLRKVAPKFPGILVAVAGSMLAVALLGLGSAGVELVGRLPQGLPLPGLPSVYLDDLPTLVGAALAAALIILADGSVLSRALAARDRREVDSDQELVAFGAANIAAGLFVGMPVSASNTRTPVAEAAGAQSAVAGLAGAVVLAALLLFASGALGTLPSATLAAVVVTAAVGLVDIGSVRRLARTTRRELAVCLAATAGVAALGAIWGIGLALGLAVLSFLWKGWRPHYAELVNVDGLEGYHDFERHPEGRRIAGMALFRFDAPLFFANADYFRRSVLALAAGVVPPPRWIVVTAEPITDVDSTAALMISELNRELLDKGISLRFAELKGTVKDQLVRHDLVEEIGSQNFYRTIDQATGAFRAEVGSDP